MDFIIWMTISPKKFKMYGKIIYVYNLHMYVIPLIFTEMFYYIM